jgi:hypothetical protein
MTIIASFSVLGIFSSFIWICRVSSSTSIIMNKCIHVVRGILLHSVAFRQCGLG